MMKEELAEIVRTFEAVGPLVGNAVKSGQLFNPQAELMEPDPDILCEYDLNIPMSEGFSVTANIFRSKKAPDKGSTGGFSGAMITDTGGTLKTNLYTNPQEDVSDGIRHIPIDDTNFQ